MDKKKIWNFAIFVPFALAIGSFILYIRYYIELKSKSDIKITEMLEMYLVRYRNIGIVCLAIGIFLLFIKTLIEYFKVDKENPVEEKKSALYMISSKKQTDDKKYTLSENKIISDLLKGKVLKAIFINEDKTVKHIKFKSYDSKKSTIEFYDLDEHKEEKVVAPVIIKETIAEPVKKEVVVIKNEENYDHELFKECKKCKKIIAKDSIICVHCGTVLREEKKKAKKPFNPVIFAVNMIIILLCIIVGLLVVNKINNQVEENRNNLNITYSIEK